jgi:hypothetical protein
MQAETILPRSATLEERIAFILQYDELKKDGHAVTLDEVRESGAVSGEMKIHHYKTCRRCAEGE